MEDSGEGPRGAAKKMFWDIDRAPYRRVLFVGQTLTRRANGTEDKKEGANREKQKDEEEEEAD